MSTKSPAKVWWRYVLLFTLVVAYRPTMHFINQALLGYPLDINYFWSELSPFGLLGSDLYNGNGGADWKIGKPKATIWNAGQLRSEPELRGFALELVNRDRIINDLPPLQADAILSQAAQLHAQDMFERQYLDHVSPDGKNPRDRYLAVGGTTLKVIGENIVSSQTESWGLTYKQAEKFQRGWMYSHGHRANVLSPEYSKFGYGVVMGANGKIYAVQKFGF
jgi:hypothetical protein